MSWCVGVTHWDNFEQLPESHVTSEWLNSSPIGTRRLQDSNYSFKYGSEAARSLLKCIWQTGVPFAQHFNSLVKMQTNPESQCNAICANTPDKKQKTEPNTEPGYRSRGAEIATEVEEQTRETLFVAVVCNSWSKVSGGKNTIQGLFLIFRLHDSDIVAGILS